MPDIERPDENQDGDEIRPENSAHDRDYLHLVYEITVPGPGPCFRAGPGGLEDVESSGSLARVHLEMCGRLLPRGQDCKFDKRYQCEDDEVPVMMDEVR